jgi:hypothetical protein
MPRKKMGKAGQDYAERRTSPRLPPEAFPSLSGAYLRGGSSVDLIDISAGGALVECEERLAPSTKICLKVVTTEGAFMLQGRILRSTISQLKGVPRYRSGIAFDQEFPLQAEDSGLAMDTNIEAAAESQISSSISPLQEELQVGQAGNGTRIVAEEILTLTTCIAQVAPDLQRIFQFSKINNW